MTNRVAYAPGEPCWNDLTSPDVAAAQRFYGALFGWTFDERATPGGKRLAVAKLDGRAVVSLAPQPPFAQGPRARWGAHVSVASADAIGARVAELGGEVLFPAGAIGDAGRMCVLADPTGGVLCAWEPGRMVGAAVRDEPGAVCWNELLTRDVARASAFLCALFGYEARPRDDRGGDYVELRLGGRPVASVMQMPASMPAHVPSFWAITFMVDDVDASAARIVELGGAIADGPRDAPGMGRFAVGFDPQGAGFGLLRPDV